MLNDRWDRYLQPQEISEVLSIALKEKRVWELVGLFESHIEGLATTSPTPNVIIVALTPEIVEEHIR